MIRLCRIKFRCEYVKMWKYENVRLCQMWKSERAKTDHCEMPSHFMNIDWRTRIIGF